MVSNPVIDTFTFVISFLKAEWLNLDFANLKFSRTYEVMLVILVFGAVIVLSLVSGYLRRNILGRSVVALPGILSNFRTSNFGFLRHSVVFIFFLGLPIFFVALADPYNSFTKETVTYPGRRIALLIDASGSMDGIFTTDESLAKDHNRFFTAVTAAKRFMELRIRGKYKDLIGLVEFGGEAYVITPFTNDYQNILMSVRLIGEPEERARFSDSNTIIIKAINQGVELFRAFDFLKASGNLMVLISDGEDTQVKLGDRPLDEILLEARRSQIPIYFIRTDWQRPLGHLHHSSAIDYDAIWKNAIEKTGGKYYAGSDEKAILTALKDIDSLSVGKISTTRYSARQPRFMLFAFAAIVIWTLAIVLWLLFRFFRTFP